MCCRKSSEKIWSEKSYFQQMVGISVPFPTKFYRRIYSDNGLKVAFKFDDSDELLLSEVVGNRFSSDNVFPTTYFVGNCFSDDVFPTDILVGNCFSDGVFPTYILVGNCFSDYLFPTGIIVGNYFSDY